MRILWCGPYFSDVAVAQKQSVSLAANKWSVGLIEAMRALGHVVDVITHCPEQAWPKGNQIWGDASKKLFYGECLRTAYLNIPVIREWWLNIRYCQLCKSAFRQHKYDAFLCYNISPSFHRVVARECKKQGVFVMPIVLDCKDPRSDGWHSFLSSIKNVDAVVLLSYWLFKSFPSHVISSTGLGSIIWRVVASRGMESHLLLSESLGLFTVVRLIDGVD